MSVPKSHRDAIVTGMTLGIYQAHAVAGSLGAGIMLTTGHYWFALILAIGAVLGWAGWKRDFDLRWRPFDDPTWRR